MPRDVSNKPRDSRGRFVKTVQGTRDSLYDRSAGDSGDDESESIGSTSIDAHDDDDHGRSSLSSSSDGGSADAALREFERTVNRSTGTVAKRERPKRRRRRSSGRKRGISRRGRSSSRTKTNQSCVNTNESYNVLRASDRHGVYRRGGRRTSSSESDDYL